MTNEEIINNAISAGLLNTAEPTKWFDEDAINSYTKCLTKFAELTKARHELQSLKTIADIREILGVGHAPMMTELPALIKNELTKARAITADYVLVPIKPTREMIDAAVFHTNREDDDEPYRARGQAIAVYSDMIQAAQQERN